MITVGDYTIKAGDMQWVVVRRILVKKGKEKGKEKDAKRRYFTKLSQAIGYVIERDLQGVDTPEVESLKVLAGRIEEVKEELAALIKEKSLETLSAGVLASDDDKAHSQASENEKAA